MAANVRIGTRGSALALWQAQWVADRLSRELPDHDVELVVVKTRGDAHTGPLSDTRQGIGFFTSEIEAALARGHVDLAVHSLKDLPASESDGPPIVAIPLRDDPADVLVSRDGRTLSDLGEGARVGTSSPRRECLVRSLRPDLEVAPIRGNVDARVRKLERGEYDAVVLAAAGLARLGLDEVVSERFDPVTFPPAPGQGAIAVQLRVSDGALGEAVARIDDDVARRTTEAERAALRALGGGCARPIGAHAHVEGTRLSLAVFVGARGGERLLRAEGTGHSPDELGRSVGEELLRLGAGELLE